MILHCIPSLGGGGAERQLCYLAKSCVGANIETHIAYIHDGPNSILLNRSGTVLHRMQAAGNYDPMIIFQILKLIYKLRPHLVQTWLTQMDVMGGIAALMTGTPFIVSERFSALAYPGGWKDRLRVRIGQNAVAVVANSEAGRHYWRKLGYRRQVIVIRNGIPIREIERVKRAEITELSVPKGNRLIVFAGRYTEEKNVVLLLQALTRVVSKRKDTYVLTFGEGPLRSELERQVRTSGLDARIRIEGFSVYLWEVMKAAELFVSISTFEGNPNTVLEAIAAHCPIVVSDIPEHREFLEESSAYFANPSSVEDVETAVACALNNRAEACAKAEIAFRAVAEWSVENRAREYMYLYRSILDG